MNKDEIGKQNKKQVTRFRVVFLPLSLPFLFLCGPLLFFPLQMDGMNSQFSVLQIWAQILSCSCSFS